MAEVSLSTREDAALASAVIEHIEKNLKPNDVFTNKVIKDFVADTWTPGEVFSQESLEAWAQAAGWSESF